MSTFLFTSIGRRVQLLKHFMNSGVRVVGADMNPEYAPASHFIDSTYQVPSYNDPSYVKRLLQICQKERVDFLIPLYEPELTLLSEYRSQFLAAGVDILLSCMDTLRICLDKYQLYQFFIKHEIATPETYLPEDFFEKSGKWVIKPRRGMASKDVYFIEIGQDLHTDILRRLSLPILQRYIDGQEYTIDAFVSKQGQIISVVPRERLEVRAGEVSKSVTRNNELIINASMKILKLLPFYGPVTLQGIQEKSSHQFYFTEINPRFGGGVPLTIQSGIPYCELIMQNHIDPSLGLLPFQDGLVMLRYEEALFQIESTRLGN